LLYTPPVLTLKIQRSPTERIYVFCECRKKDYFPIEGKRLDFITDGVCLLGGAI